MKHQKVYQISLGTVYIMLLIFFTWQSLKSGESSASTSDWVSHMISSFLEMMTGKEFPVDERFTYLIRKWIGHFGYFVFLGFVSCLFYRTFQDGSKRRFLWISIHYANGFIFAFLSEFVFQMLASGRTASMLDVLLDYGGFLALSLPLSSFLLFRDRKRYNDCKGDEQCSSV